jgi:hypothetical protein
MPVTKADIVRLAKEDWGYADGTDITEWAKDQGIEEEAIIHIMECLEINFMKNITQGMFVHSAFRTAVAMAFASGWYFAVNFAQRTELDEH